MNKPPKVLQIALLALAFAGVVVWAWRSFGPAPAPAAGTSQSAPEPGHLVLVTYFTTGQRCPACLKIERQTREAVHAGFPAELAAGAIRFRTINFDRPENKHFIDDYGLAFKTVVVSEHRHGKVVKWERYDQVWDLAGEPEAFAAFLQKGIRSHLKAETDA